MARKPSSADALRPALEGENKQTRGATAFAYVVTPAKAGGIDIQLKRGNTVRRLRSSTVGKAYYASEPSVMQAILPKHVSNLRQTSLFEFLNKTWPRGNIASIWLFRCPHVQPAGGTHVKATTGSH